MRGGVPRQLALYNKYKDCVNFLTIYIKEAHTRDEWPLGNDFCWKNPKTMEERMALAHKFNKEMDYEIPMVVDAFDDPFNDHFSSWPERYYIIHQGKLAYKAMPVTDTYLWEELEEWILNYKNGNVQ